MNQPRWITVAIATAIHDEAIYEFGGLPGIRNRGLLESTLDRRRNLMAYEPESPVSRLAAALCAGLARNPPFNDGNKRTALLSARAFLYLNGHALEPREDDEVATMVAVADASIGEEEIVSWLTRNSTPID